MKRSVRRSPRKRSVRKRSVRRSPRKRSVRKRSICWKGYHRVPGTVAYTKGSCKKN